MDKNYQQELARVRLERASESITCRKRDRCRYTQRCIEAI